MLDYNSIPEEDRRTITRYAQKVNLVQLETLIMNEQSIWNKYVQDFPEFEAIYNGYNERHEYCRQNKQAFLDAFYGNKKTPELKTIEKQIRQQYNKLAKKITQIIDESPIVVPCDAKPNLNGTFYKAAEVLAGRIAELWYIDKVFLFGSVAKGKETAESDVDLSVEFVTKQRSVYLERWINVVVDEWADEYQMKPADVVIHTSKLEKLGYFNPSILLADSQNLEIRFKKDFYSIPKSQLVRFNIENAGGNLITSCLYKMAERYWHLTIINNIPILITKVELIDNYEIDFDILDVSETIFECDINYLTEVTYSGFFNMMKAVSEGKCNSVWREWVNQLRDIISRS